MTTPPTNQVAGTVAGLRALMRHPWTPALDTEQVIAAHATLTRAHPGSGRSLGATMILSSYLTEAVGVTSADQRLIVLAAATARGVRDASPEGDPDRVAGMVDLLCELLDIDPGQHHGQVVDLLRTGDVLPIATHIASTLSGDPARETPPDSAETATDRTVDAERVGAVLRDAGTACSVAALDALALTPPLLAEAQDRADQSVILHGLYAALRRTVAIPRS